MNAIASSSRSSTLLCSTLLSSSPTSSRSSRRTFSSSSRWSAASAADNHYLTLNIDRGASRKQIKERFYELSKKYHPDLTPGDKVAKAKYLSISEAYDTLGNESKRSLYDRSLSPVPRATHTSTHYTRTGRPSTWVHPSTRLPPRPRSTMLHHQQQAQRPPPSNTTNGASQPFPFNHTPNPSGRPALGSQMPRSSSSHFGTPPGGGGGQASFNSPFSPYLNPDTLQSRYNPVTGKPDLGTLHPSMGPGTTAFASFAANGFGFGKRNQPPTPPPHPRYSSPSFTSSANNNNNNTDSSASMSSTGFARPLIRKGGGRRDRERSSTLDAAVRSTAPSPSFTTQDRSVKEEFLQGQLSMWMFGAALTGVGAALVLGWRHDRKRGGVLQA